VITIFGTTYFTIGAGFVVLVLAAPFLFWFARWLWRPNVEDKPRRVRWLAVGGTTFGLLLLLAVGLFWDVYLIGQRAKELCRETGLVVYRRESTSGFAGSAAIEKWAKHGFQFVETDHSGTAYRYEIVDGTTTRTRIDSLKSEYLLSLVDFPVEAPNRGVGGRIARRGAAITERRTNEIVAELVKFTIRYGWGDTAIINTLGFVAPPHTCGRDQNGEISFSESALDIEDLVLAALRPAGPLG